MCWFYISNLYSVACINFVHKSSSNHRCLVQKMEIAKLSLAGQTDFSLQLAHRVASTSPADSNLALSPLLIHAALSLIAAGSKGATLHQLASVLRAADEADLQSLSSNLASFVLADGSLSGGPRILFSSGVWVDASLSLKSSFKEIANSAYKAEAKTVDFQTKANEVKCEVNSWAENATAGLIKELLPTGSIDHNTRLVLCNALYYKDVWEEKFDASKTKESEFYLLNGSSINVPFMTSRKEQYISEYDGFKVLRLRYKQGDDRRHFSMYIFLPDAKDGLSNLHERMSSKSRFLDLHSPWRKVKVGKFKLPKFKISFGFEATKVLKDLGLTLPFTSDGDLTGMADLPVHVSSIYHKSAVEVNEEGTEAAAATAVVVMPMCLTWDPDRVNFEADHPFFFVIKDDMSGAVLFVGDLMNPLTG